MQFNNYVAIVNGIYFVLNNMSKIRANINSLSRSRSYKVIFQYEIFPSSDKMQIKMCKTFVESNCTFLKYHFTKFNAFSILQNWFKGNDNRQLTRMFCWKAKPLRHLSRCSSKQDILICYSVSEFKTISGWYKLHVNSDKFIIYDLILFSALAFKTLKRNTKQSILK